MEASSPLHLPESLEQFHPLMKLLVSIGEDVRAMQPGIGFEAKADGSPVTKADLHVRDRLGTFLKSAYPDLGSLSEEGLDDASGGDTWIIDEIDGTNPYKNGDSEYGISIGKRDAGFLYFPARRILIAAASGRGAFINGEPIRLDATRRIALERATIAYGYAQSRELRERYMTAVRPILVAASNSDARGSTVDAFRRMLEGPVDAMIVGGATIQDIGAIVPIAREAGIPLWCPNGNLDDLPAHKDSKLFFVAARSQALMEEMRGMLPGEL